MSPPKDWALVLAAFLHKVQKGRGSRFCTFLGATRRRSVPAARPSERTLCLAQGERAARCRGAARAPALGLWRLCHGLPCRTGLRRSQMCAGVLEPRTSGLTQAAATGWAVARLEIVDFSGLLCLGQACRAAGHPPAASGMWKSLGLLLDPDLVPQQRVWKPCLGRQPRAAVTCRPGQLLHVDQFPLNFTLGTSKERRWLRALQEPKQPVPKQRAVKAPSRVTLNGTKGHSCPFRVAGS